MHATQMPYCPRPVAQAADEAGDDLRLSPDRNSQRHLSKPVEARTMTLIPRLLEAKQMHRILESER